MEASLALPPPLEPPAEALSSPAYADDEEELVDELRVVLAAPVEPSPAAAGVVALRTLSDVGSSHTANPGVAHADSRGAAPMLRAGSSSLPPAFNSDNVVLFSLDVDAGASGVGPDELVLRSAVDPAPAVGVSGVVPFAAELQAAAAAAATAAHGPPGPFVPYQVSEAVRHHAEEYDLGSAVRSAEELRALAPGAVHPEVAAVAVAGVPLDSKWLRALLPKLVNLRLLSLRGVGLDKVRGAPGACAFELVHARTAGYGSCPRSPLPVGPGPCCPACAWPKPHTDSLTERPPPPPSSNTHAPPHAPVGHAHFRAPPPPPRTNPAPRCPAGGGRVALAASSGPAGQQAAAGEGPCGPCHRLPEACVTKRVWEPPHGKPRRLGGALLAYVCVVKGDRTNCATAPVRRLPVCR
jgi:hypothetical protein